jgi:hypothetical protein
MTQKRKRGRLKVKEVALKCRVGRPRKEPLNPENLPPPKRRVGRPPKIKSSGGVVVEFGPIVIHSFYLYMGYSFPYRRLSLPHVPFCNSDLKHPYY